MSQSLAIQIQKNGLVAEIATAFAGSLLLWLSAKVQIPFWPVPMTMQTLVVVLLPILFGTRAGVGAVVLYLMEGMMGLPVFAGTPVQGIGVVYMVGPTGGFLAGFLGGAIISGLIAQHFKPNFMTGLMAATAGHAFIFLLGVSWLAQSLGWTQALAVGFIPFMAASVVKILMAASITKIASQK
jgi:biotin transport system substrate-specific component